MVDVNYTLITLEPIAAIGLGFGLAYLNLERFRYRKQVREYAEASIKRFTSESTRQEFKKMGCYHRICKFAGLPDNNPTETNGSKKKGDLGRGVYRKIYSWFYDFHLDRKLIGILTVITVATIVLGVYFQIYPITSSVESWEKFLFFVVLTSLIVPPSAVWVGNKIVIDMKTQIDEDSEDILMPMVDQAQQVKPPSQPLQSPVKPVYRAASFTITPTKKSD